MTTTKAIPAGFHTVTPYLTVPGVAKLIDFVKQAFDAKEMYRSNRPDGSIQHAQVQIGDSMVMMGEPQGEWTAKPASIFLYVEDTDAVYARAVQAGAKSLREPADQSHGDRMGGVEDASGNQWWIATHIKD